jgi:hypothetical protein
VAFSAGGDGVNGLLEKQTSLAKANVMSARVGDYHENYDLGRIRIRVRLGPCDDTGSRAEF